MMINKKWVLIFILALGLAFLAASCAVEPVEVTVPVEVRVTELVEVTRMVEVMVTPEVTPEPPLDVPFHELWEESPHADAEAEAFRHWDEDDPAVVPTSCAKCHSTPGYRDYLGVDGSAPGSVEEDVPVGSTIECVACHNLVTIQLDTVTFPSGLEIHTDDDASRCMVCHQGRESTVSVNADIEEVGVDADTVSEDLGFINIHYYAAAATLYGNEAQGGYQYEGKGYDTKFVHVEELDTCIECHDQHTTEVRVELCGECHEGVAEVEDLKEARMDGSLVDYDGDGDVEEGVFYEIETLREMLYTALQAYADEVTGAPIVYEGHSYPYFFNDTNADGEASEDEAAFPNRYASWSPRLVKAAYNYQVSLKDPGAFAHNAKYIIELLYDSIEDLNTSISSPVDLSAAHRRDPGHFAGTEEAFRHWDEDGEVSGSCAKCHSGEGLPFYLEHGTNIAAEPTNGLLCKTCHDALPEFSRRPVEEVTFPSGLVASIDPDSNLCLLCHQGRESTVSVNRRIGNSPDDTVAEGLGFVNVHYFAAGATLFGTEAQGAYEYEGNEYVGRRVHVPKYDTCIECHTAHELEVQVDECAVCHEVESLEGLHSIRDTETPDYDGDGDTTEGVFGEIESMQSMLYDAMVQYSTDMLDNPIAYDSHSYPYFFIDTNANGEVDPDETDRYDTWSPRLLRAAYNYQYSQKDPGGYAHNPAYVGQILYDTLRDMGADVSGMTRP